MDENVIVTRKGASVTIVQPVAPAAPDAGASDLALGLAWLEKCSHYPGARALLTYIGLLEDHIKSAPITYQIHDRAVRLDGPCSAQGGCYCPAGQEED